MNREETEQLRQDIERSVQMRQAISGRLARNEVFDLLEAWTDLEQLDQDIARRIRKRRPE
jgi:hypothetical protein